jgi:hypothetical protein
MELDEHTKQKLFSYRMLLKKNAPHIFREFKRRKLEKTPENKKEDETKNKQ